MALDMAVATSKSSAVSTNMSTRQRWDSAPESHRHVHAANDRKQSPSARSADNQRDEHENENASFLDDNDDEEDAEIVAARVEDRLRDDVIRAIFDLPPHTRFYRDCSCAVNETFAIAAQGRLYPTKTLLCFYSNVFGRERKLVLPFAAMQEITKTTAGMFQGAILIRMQDERDNVTFTSFWGTNRDRCFELLTKLRQRALRRDSSTLAMSSSTSSPLSSSRASSSSSISTEPQLSPRAITHEPMSPSSATTETHSPRNLEDAASGDDEVAAIMTDEARPPVHPRTDSSVESRSPSPVPIPAAPRKKEGMTVVLDTVLDVSPDAFVAAFLDDDAAFGLDEYQRRMGATEIEVQPWTRPTPDDEVDTSVNVGRYRKQRFRTPVTAPIGPKTSVVNVQQSLRAENDGVYIMESSTQLTDFPYSDYFTVEEQWTISPLPATPASCQLIIEVKGEMVKSTIWRGQILSRAISDSREKWGQWLKMAQEHLLASRAVLHADEQQRPRASTMPQGMPAPSSSSSSSRRVVPSSGSRRSKGVHRHHHHHVSNNMPNPPKRFAIIFPWLVIVALLFTIMRLQTSVTLIEHSLQETSQRVLELQAQMQRMEQFRLGGER